MNYNDVGKYKKLRVNNNIIQDAINIFNGVYAPLNGFLRKEDFQSVLDSMRLANGQVWSMPIILDIDEDNYTKLKDEKKVVLVSEDNKQKAVLENIEIYKYDKKELAEKVYGTQDIKHPGVAGVMSMGDYLVGGDVKNIVNINKVFPGHNLTPKETKKIFSDLGWKTIVAFQTRNVPHVGHEFLQKQALKEVDGLFIQPVIGEKKLEDFKDEYIVAAYEILINKYFSKGKAILGALPLKMRYAGPREAIIHALIRKNFGCTHFIVGRDHAGVGNYYEPFAAQEIFNKFDKQEIGIEIIKFKEVVYDKKREKHCFIDECPKKDIMNFSGTSLRTYLKNKEQPPEYLIRPEVFSFLSFSYNLLVDKNYKNDGSSKGFVLWLTGLSAAGKTTIGDKVSAVLENRNVKTERLDGDVVRESLTKDLGFSKEDRDENIRRIGSVANLLCRNGVGVIASFISPYIQQRHELKRKTKNLIEVFVDTPLEVCEKRDTKGLYKKARAGEIKFFTGISDPYEKPKNPDIHLKTDQMSVEECVNKVIDYLKNKKLIN